MQETINLVISIVTLGAIIFAIYKYFHEPGIKNQEKIQEMEIAYNLKHEAIDKALFEIQQNHLPHIEECLDKIGNRLTRIETILNERSEK